MNYARSLNDLLWDMYQDKAWASFIMDENENGVSDGPSSIALNLCQTSNLVVEDIGEFIIDPLYDCLGHEQVFILKEDGSTISSTLFGYDEENTLWGGFNIGSTTPRPGLFAVDSPYPIGEGSEFFTTFGAK